MQPHRAIPVAINRIADDGRADVCRMHPDLVGAAGFGAEFHQARRGIQHLPVRARRLAIAAHHHPPPGFGAGNLGQRRIHQPGRFGGQGIQHRPIDFFHAAAGKGRRQRLHPAPRQRHRQAA